MEGIITWLVKNIIVSVILLAYYWLFLRNRNFHRFNRFYLLSAMGLSVIIPFISFETSAAVSFDLIPAGLTATVAHRSNLPVLLISMAWIAVALSFIAFYCLQIKKIYSLKKQYPVDRRSGYDFIDTNLEEAPFTFLKNLFWRSSINTDKQEGRHILDHEMAHIKGRHSYDRLFTQLFIAVCWMNPFYRVFQKELSLVHEFIADQQSLKKGDSEAFARMLLYSYEQQQPANKFYQGFFYSSIKRRIVMINKTKNPFSIGRRLLALPVVAACFFAACSKTSETAALSQEYETVLDLVVEETPKGTEEKELPVNKVILEKMFPLEKIKIKDKTFIVTADQSLLEIREEKKQ